MKILLTAAVAAFAAVTSYAQVDPNRVVAIVNGDEIKGSEYYRRMEYLPGVGKPNGQQFNEMPPGFITIAQLVTERLVLQLAKKQGVLPTDAEVEAEYEARKKDNPNLDRGWLLTGQNVDELKYQIKLELAQFNIQTFGVTVTNQEVDDYYTKHPDDFTLPKAYKLSVIVVSSDADKQKVTAALAAGAKFTDVAKQYSTDASKNLGGELGLVPETRLGPPVVAALVATKIGSNTDWISSNGSSVKFAVEDIQAPRKLPLDDSLRRRIRRKLMIDRGQVKNDVTKEMKEMRSQAAVDIKQPEFKDAYDKYIKTYLQGG